MLSGFSIGAAAPAGESAATPCAQQDPELWFAEAEMATEVAKALCRRCPIQEACLADALQRGEPWGVWGGEVLLDGAVQGRKRGRGRPRKDELAAEAHRTAAAEAAADQLLRTERVVAA